MRICRNNADFDSKKLTHILVGLVLVGGMIVSIMIVRNKVSPRRTPFSESEKAKAVSLYLQPGTLVSGQELADVIARFKGDTVSFCVSTKALQAGGSSEEFGESGKMLFKMYNYQHSSSELEERGEELDSYADYGFTASDVDYINPSGLFRISFEEEKQVSIVYAVQE